MFSFIVISCLIYIHSVSTDFQDQITSITDHIRAYGPEVWCKFQPNGYMCKEKEFVSKYYYDLLLDGCKSANFGLCKYNDLNAFDSLADCYYQCRGVADTSVPQNVTRDIYCRLQPEFGHCYSYHPMFYYDLTLRECRGFSYSGCGGNPNRFHTHQQCSAACAGVMEY